MDPKIALLTSEQKQFRKKQEIDQETINFLTPKK
jgi:hypothetical protein